MLYLEEDVKGEGFRVLMTRIRQNAAGLREEMTILDTIIAQTS